VAGASEGKTALTAAYE
jgi:hypothetical protein